MYVYIKVLSLHKGVDPELYLLLSPHSSNPTVSDHKTLSYSGVQVESNVTRESNHEVKGKPTNNQRDHRNCSVLWKHVTNDLHIHDTYLCAPYGTIPLITIVLFPDMPPGIILEYGTVWLGEFTQFTLGEGQYNITPY